MEEYYETRNNDLKPWSEIKNNVYGPIGTQRRDDLEREAETFKNNKIILKNLTDWDNHLDNKYGKIGTASRDKFELELDWWINISQDERNAIDEGLEDIKNGKVLAHQQVMDEQRSRYGELV